MFIKQLFMYNTDLADSIEHMLHILAILPCKTINERVLFLYLSTPKHFFPSMEFLYGWQIEEVAMHIMWLVISNY